MRRVRLVTSIKPPTDGSLIAMTSRLSESRASKRRSISSFVISILPMRSRSSMSSRLCDSSEISPKPSMPASPLSEWTSRKILLMTSGRTSRPCDSNSTRSRESVSSSSSASPVNSSRARSSSLDIAGIVAGVVTSAPMAAQLIDGKQVAKTIEAEVVAAIRALGIAPGLVAVRVGNDPASEVYVRSKAKKARERGLRGDELILPESTSEAELLAHVDRLNHDDDVDGILVQLPLPPQIDSKKVIDAIDPSKDVDGFHPINVGKLHLGRPTLAPCTPAGVIRLIESTGVAIAGSNAVVIGRSDIVGKPMAALLLQRNATVTIAHSRTRDLASVVRGADLIVAAVGKPLLVTREMVKPGAVVIDVGMNRLGASGADLVAHDEEKSRLLAKNGTVLVGDVDFARVRDVAGWITPVPGGVGPMTIAMLMRNTVTAAEWRRR